VSALARPAASSVEPRGHAHYVPPPPPLPMSAQPTTGIPDANLGPPPAPACPRLAMYDRVRPEKRATSHCGNEDDGVDSLSFCRLRSPRVHSGGVLGLARPGASPPAGSAIVCACAGRQTLGGESLTTGKPACPVGHPGLLDGRLEPYRFAGHEARRARGDPRRIPAGRHQGSWHLRLRAPATPGGQGRPPGDRPLAGTHLHEPPQRNP
jgi:hypothetical protein